MNRESIRSTWTLVLTAGLILGPRAGNAFSLDDFQLRPAIHVEEWARGPLALLGWAELRWTDDLARFTNWRIGQRLQYNPWRELTVGVGYTFIRQDGLDAFSGQDLTLHAHRAELEATPHLRLTENLTFNGRARFENRWIEGNGNWNPLLRIRPELVLKVHHAGPLTEGFTSNEFFYDLERGRYLFNRMIPAGVTFELGADVRLRLMYIVDSQERNDGWHHVHAFQTQLHYSFR